MTKKELARMRCLAHIAKTGGLDRQGRVELAELALKAANLIETEQARAYVYETEGTHPMGIFEEFCDSNG